MDQQEKSLNVLKQNLDLLTQQKKELQQKLSDIKEENKEKIGNSKELKK